MVQYKEPEKEAHGKLKHRYVLDYAVFILSVSFGYIKFIK